MSGTFVLIIITWRYVTISVQITAREREFIIGLLFLRPTSYFPYTDKNRMPTIKKVIIVIPIVRESRTSPMFSLPSTFMKITRRNIYNTALMNSHIIVSNLCKCLFIYSPPFFLLVTLYMNHNMIARTAHISDTYFIRWIKPLHRFYTIFLILQLFILSKFFFVIKIVFRFPFYA